MSQLRALLSVANKRGLTEFARQLHDAGVALIASGGTAKQIADAGLPVTAVEEITGFPEILGGRVKTLHPAIHGGILARRTADHLAELADHDLTPIDLVVINLYPFQQTVAQAGVTLTDAIEQIDIGGVALLRAAAKNHESVTVVCNPADYDAVAQAFANGGTDAEERMRLALRAFHHTATYDTAIASYLEGQVDAANETASAKANADALPPNIQLNLTLQQRNRYGENPHQQGGLYGYAGTKPAFTQLHGKEMGYNNWLDLDGSWQAAQDFTEPSVAIIKHGNPCGLASANNLAAAYDKALASDSLSAFGSVISVNRPLDVAVAERMADLFIEVVAAPAFDPDALEILRKKKNRRILLANDIAPRDKSVRSIYGGLLVQTLDRSEDDMAPAAWRIVSKQQPTGRTTDRFSLCLARCPPRQEQRDYLCQRAGYRWCRRRADESGGFGDVGRA